MNLRGRPLSVTDDELLDAARDVFLARGLDATTAEIARRARISESVIFYRYKTKEALFIAVFDRAFVIPPAFIRLGTVVGEGSIADHLFDAGMGLLDLTQSILPFMMMTLSSSKLNVWSERARQPHPAKREMSRLLASYLAAEMRAGRLRRVDAEILANTFLGAIAQYVMAELLQRQKPLPMPEPTFLRGMIDVLLHGVEPPARPRRGRARSRR